MPIWFADTCDRIDERAAVRRVRTLVLLQVCGAAVHSGFGAAREHARSGEAALPAALA